MFPLAYVWLMADARKDILTKIRVNLAVADTVNGLTSRVLWGYYERWAVAYRERS